MTLKRLQSALGLKKEVTIKIKGNEMKVNLDLLANFGSIAPELDHTDDLHFAKLQMIKHIDNNYKTNTTNEKIKTLFKNELLEYYKKAGKDITPTEIPHFLVKAGDILGGITSTDSKQKNFKEIFSEEKQNEYKIDAVDRLMSDQDTKTNNHITPRDYIGKYIELTSILGKENIKKEHIDIFKDNMKKLITQHIQDIKKDRMSTLFYNQIHLSDISKLLSEEEYTDAVLQGFQILKDTGSLTEMPVFEYDKPNDKIIAGIQKIVEGETKNTEKVVSTTQKELTQSIH